LRDAVGARQFCLRGTLREALHGLPALMAHGYEQTREAAMAAFAKSWRR
jgi:hypothetical protein